MFFEYEGYLQQICMSDRASEALAEASYRESLEHTMTAVSSVRILRSVDDVPRHESLPAINWNGT